jgi:hypothetical protein
VPQRKKQRVGPTKASTTFPCALFCFPTVFCAQESSVAASSQVQAEPDDSVESSSESEEIKQTSRKRKLQKSDAKSPRAAASHGLVFPASRLSILFLRPILFFAVQGLEHLKRLLQVQRVSQKPRTSDPTATARLTKSQSLVRASRLRHREALRSL